MYKTVVCSSTAVRKGLHTPEVTHKGPSCAITFPLDIQSCLSCWDYINHLLCDMYRPPKCTLSGNMLQQLDMQRMCYCGHERTQYWAHMQVPRPSARSHRSTSMTLTSSPSGEAAQE